MEEIKLHCEIIMQILRDDYGRQLEYRRIIKDIYDIASQITRCEDISEIPEVNWIGLIRNFVDDTTDYTSPVIAELEKVSCLSQSSANKCNNKCDNKFIISF